MIGKVALLIYLEDIGQSERIHEIITFFLRHKIL